jgi:RNA polymerase sigma-70 factor, ECF subfamily
LSDELTPTGDDRRMTESEQRAAFGRVFAQHHRWLYAYLVSLLGGAAEAEEVFQEVCVVLWREYESFQLGTNFVKWVSVIAHHQVQKFRRSQRRREHQLSDDTIELLAADAIEQCDLLDSRRTALSRCLEQLNSSDRQLVAACYRDSRDSFKAVAEQIGRPANTVYKALNRIRHNLQRCIDRSLAAEGS